MKSLRAMVQQIAGLAGTKDVTAWETDFITSVAEQVNQGRVLSPKQAEIVERIYQKHFGDG